MSPQKECLLSSWASSPGDAQAKEAYKQVQSALGRSTALSSNARNLDKYITKNPPG